MSWLWCVFTVKRFVFIYIIHYLYFYDQFGNGRECPGCGAYLQPKGLLLYICYIISFIFFMIGLGMGESVLVVVRILQSKGLFIYHYLSLFYFFMISLGLGECPSCGAYV